MNSFLSQLRRHKREMLKDLDIKLADLDGLYGLFARLEMDKVAVQVEPGSLTGPVIVINEVTVDGARLTAEQKGTSTNLTQISNGMKPASEEPARTAAATACTR